jgi:uncharacterized protein (TIGR02444 family)
VEDQFQSLHDPFDVNLVLLCAFAGAVHGVSLTAEDVASARTTVRQWQDEIVLPLRAARRNLKTIVGAQDAKAAEQLRTQVKAAELEAERIEQAALQRWCDARLKGRARGQAREAVTANLRALLAVYGLEPAADTMPQIVAAALARAQPA